MTEAEIVSFDDEPLILVDKDDRCVGHEEKVLCHQGEGLLHRAFSVFIFNSANELLLQQRSNEKPLWPLYWANTCCSHPRRGEDTHVAAHRRLAEELGLEAEIKYLFKFQYHASFRGLGSEHELCWVFMGRSNAEPKPNPTEIAETRWVGADELDAAIETDAESYSPWLKMEWKRLRETYWARIESL